MTSRKREPDVRFRFGHDVHAGREARRQLEPLLSEPDDVIAADVRLAATEMVTNVVVHTKGGGELRAWDPRPDVPLLVEVEDGDVSPPSIPAQPPEVGGYGMAIVAAVSDKWGYRLQAKGKGKVVWAEFDRDKRRLAHPVHPVPPDRPDQPDGASDGEPVAAPK